MCDADIFFLLSHGIPQILLQRMPVLFARHQLIRLFFLAQCGLRQDVGEGLTMAGLKPRRWSMLRAESLAFFNARVFTRSVNMSHQPSHFFTLHTHTHTPITYKSCAISEMDDSHAIKREFWILQTVIPTLEYISNKKVLLSCSVNKHILLVYNEKRTRCKIK